MDAAALNCLLVCVLLLQLHHDTPDANLAWLMALLGVPDSSSSNGGCDKKPPATPQQQQPPPSSAAAAPAAGSGLTSPATALDGMVANTRMMLEEMLADTMVLQVMRGW